MSQQQPNNLLASMKRASQRFAGVVADTGAKTMLKVRANLCLPKIIVSLAHAKRLCPGRVCALERVLLARGLPPLENSVSWHRHLAVGQNNGRTLGGFVDVRPGICGH